MAYSTRRYSYDEDTSSAQNLWIVVIVVGAMVGSFVFGRYVLGDRIRRDADDPATIGEQATLGQPSPADVSAQQGFASLPTDPPPAPAADESPTNVNVFSSDEDDSPVQELPPRTAQLEEAMANPPADREAERAKEEEARQRAEAARREAERKKKEAAERERREAERRKEEEARRRRDEQAARPPAGTAGSRPPAAPGRPTTTARPTPTPAVPDKPKPEAQPAEPASMHRVRAGTFETAEAAAERQRQVREKGQDALVVVRESNGRRVYDVQVGAFQSRENANSLANELRTQGIDASVAD